MGLRALYLGVIYCMLIASYFRPLDRLDVIVTVVALVFIAFGEAPVNLFARIATVATERFLYGSVPPGAWQYIRTGRFPHESEDTP